MKAQIVSVFFLAAALTQARSADLIEVASFPDRQVTGVAVSKTGRIFVNFPDWSDPHTISVGEWKAGQLKPYPDAEWNNKGEPASHFVCVQSVYVDDTDALWILDPASPKMDGVVKGGAKLIKIDLATDKVVQTIPFGDNVAPKKSYLNDVRVDTKAQFAFITESGEGSLVVVDLKNGSARRLLEGHESTAAEKGFELTVDGRKLIDQKTGKPPKINADGIALDRANDYLFYHALTAHTLYRIKTEHLKNTNLSKSDLASKVEKMGETAAPDGMLEENHGGVYLTDIEHRAIARFELASKKLETALQDPRLLWPDTLAWGPDGMLYVACSQIQNAPRFNKGKDMRTTPYKVYKFAIKH